MLRARSRDTRDHTSEITMTTNAVPDPVNRWATEHYGFADADAGQDAALTGPTSSSVPPPPPADRVSPPRHRAAVIAAGILSVLLVSGVGGAAVGAVAVGDDPGVPGGRGAGISQVVGPDRGAGDGADGPFGGRR
jgi:hypothetical protein